MKKVFLDSDIILDALLKRPEFVLPAINIISLANIKIRIVTSSVAFVNVHHFLDKFDRSNTSLLMKNLRSMLSVVQVDETIVDLALESGLNDFEDAIQYFAAKSANAEVIITRNIKDYKRSTLPILTPEQFLKTL